MQPLVLLFRGMSTHGDENLRFSKLKIGPMMGPWSRYFKKNNLEARTVQGMGNGHIQNNIDKAALFINQIPDIESRKLILMGHSTGGLVARALVHHPTVQHLNFRAVISVATPHKGTRTAELAGEFATHYPKTYKTMRLIGYDFNSKKETFANLTRERVNAFNLQFPDRSEIIYASSVFSLEKDEMSWPVQSVYRHTWSKNNEPPRSDGFVEEESQAWGEKWFSLPLDHICQIGYNFYVSPRLRQEKISLYNQFLSQLAEKIRKL